QLADVDLLDALRIRLPGHYYRLVAPEGSGPLDIEEITTRVNQQLDEPLAAEDVEELWKLASGVNQRDNPYPMVIGTDEHAGPDRRQADAAILEVTTAYARGGRDAAVARAKELGQARGVRPSTGGLGMGKVRVGAYLDDTDTPDDPDQTGESSKAGEVR